MSIRKLFFIFLATLSLAPLFSEAAERKWSNEIDIPFKKFTLPNGLRVVIHEDHKAPIVAVHTWYHVGSKNERPGKTGFAHLFEHVMFNGSEHFNDDYFKAMDKIGSTVTNGSTGFDRTNYFQVVPSNQLDTVLWMESDRMGHLLGAVDQAKLDEQRGVVQNEKRQRENQPYGRVFETIFRSIYPNEHPYSWMPIGSMEDLNRATLDDVKEWFKTYYGAANAVVSIAGDVDTEQARKKVEQYFGDIPSGPPLSRPESWIAQRTTSTRATMQDRVPLARLYKVWTIPSLRDNDEQNLDIFSDILAGNKNSRLYKRLVFDEQIAADVSAFTSSGEIGSLFAITATAKQGQSLDKIEAEIQQELDLVLKKGCTKEELEKYRTQFYAGFIRGMEKIGGGSGKAETLIEGEVFFSNPAQYKNDLDYVQTVSTDAIVASAKKWLSQGDFTLQVVPYKEGATTPSTVDRSKLPVATQSAARKFPEFKRLRLPNGLNVLLMERKSTPTVDFNLIMTGGYIGEQNSPFGTARMTMSLLTEGTKKLTSLEFADKLEKLATSISAGVSHNNINVRLSTLKKNLDESLSLYAETIFSPGFRQTDFSRIQKQLLDSLESEKSSPEGLTLRLYPALIYGKNHPYAVPVSGLGNKGQINAIQLAQVEKYYQTWFQPKDSTLVIVGDISEKDAMAKVQKYFSDWQPKPTPEVQIYVPGNNAKTKIYLVDRKDSMQSLITASHLAPAKKDAFEADLLAMNLAFGGSFTSRVNLNLREDKHWSYGARSGFSDTNVVRTFGINASVQTDKTKESMVEIRNEIAAISKSKPLTQAELEKSKISQTIGFSSSWETNASMVSYLSSLVSAHLSDDYFDTYIQRAEKLTSQDAQKTVPVVMNPDQMIWMVVGDLAKIEQSIRDLKWAEVTVLDTEGNVVR